MLFRMKKLLSVAVLWVPVSVLFLFSGAGHSQPLIQSIQEIETQITVKNGNYLKARKQAIYISLKKAVKNALLDFMGEAEYKANKRYLRKILKNSKRYVQSYRFLEAFDDMDAEVSFVKLEVVLYPDAITKSLANLGVIPESEGAKRMVILIQETSFSAPVKSSFWNSVPISETALSQDFIEAGISVVSRTAVQNLFPEEWVENAGKGDISAAVNIGLKAGADIVIVGNAVSTLVKKDFTEGEKVVQATISVKVVSSLKSALIAAKSDFATARKKEALAGELLAFSSASQKLARFLLPSIQRHWERGTENGKKKQAKPKTTDLPMSLTDL